MNVHSESDAPGRTQGMLDELIARATIDSDFRMQLIENPREIMCESGLDIPEKVEVKVVESSDNRTILPLFPYQGDKLSLDSLDAVSGGTMDPSILGGSYIQIGPQRIRVSGQNDSKFGFVGFTLGG